MNVKHHDLVITRDFQATRERIWEAWTLPDQIARWWGPRGFSTEVSALDLRPGGAWRYLMKGPDGTEYPVRGVFREVDPPERLVTSDDFEPSDAETPATDFPQGVVVTCTFTDLGEETRLALRISHPTEEDLRRHEEMGVVAGWQSSFGCLDDFLEE